MLLYYQYVSSPSLNVDICAMNILLSTTFIFFVLNRIVHVAYSFSLNSRKSLISSSISALIYFSFSNVVCSFCEFVSLVFFLVLLIPSCNSWWSDKTHGVSIFCIYKILQWVWICGQFISFMRWWAGDIFSYILVESSLNISWIHVHSVKYLEYFFLVLVWRICSLVREGYWNHWV